MVAALEATVVVVSAASRTAVVALALQLCGRLVRSRHMRFAGREFRARLVERGAEFCCAALERRTLLVRTRTQRLLLRLELLS